jgi:hypothetical protein
LQRRNAAEETARTEPAMEQLDEEIDEIRKLMFRSAQRLPVKGS